MQRLSVKQKIFVYNKILMDMRFIFKGCYLLVLQSLLFNTAEAQTNFQPPGKLIDAGGHLLHMNAMGKGTPTVIFESGSGDFSFIWSLVQPAVSKFTRTVSYDRAGFAWSEPGPTPRTARQITFELHIALINAGIKPPYILVGQSFGGFLVRAFARYYPKDVVGMVLVEALNENARIIIGDKPMRIRDWATGRIAPGPQSGNKKYSSTTFNTDQLDSTIEFPLTKLSDSVKQMQIWAQSQPAFRAASDSEMSWSPEDVEKLFENRGKPGYSLGKIPLIVLTRGLGGYDGRADSADLENERLTQQKELAALSTNSEHIIDKNSGHNIHLEDPQIVINAIKEVIIAVRTEKPLRK